MIDRAARKTGRGRGHLEIAAALGCEILSGARQPGSRLPDVPEMHKRFGVSRVVVREVMRTLAAKGMVKSKPKVGTIVSDPSSWSWLDPQILEWRGKVGLDLAFLTQLTEVRLALEPAAAGIAAKNRTDQDLAILQAALKAMYQAEGDHKKFSSADRDFHNAIVAATHNPFFYSSVSATSVALSGFLSWISIGVTADKSMHTRSAAMHAKIFDAIAAQDAKSATRAMIRVIEESLKDGSSQLTAGKM
jgi:DNA-binding FadR family transcriptional regulator